VVTHCYHLERLKFSPALPHAFTEYGTIMLANVLNSQVAIQASIQIVRTFIKLREVATTHKDVVRRLDALEKKYDAQFRVVFDAIRRLMAAPRAERKEIGFLVEEGTAWYGRA